MRRRMLVPRSATHACDLIEERERLEDVACRMAVNSATLVEDQTFAYLIADRASKLAIVVAVNAECGLDFTICC